MQLIIVESPTKARTISKFLGREYKVKSSFGHIRDLPQKEMGVDIENNFIPKYVVNRKAQKKVKPLKEEMKKAASVILATDEDREGEAIAWHLSEILKLNPQEKNRIVFHEITKKAIEEALERPRSIDFHLVDAQQARRVLDRLVGYELSPLLWKKIKRGLSAGRVQSIALRIICEREREIEKFEKQVFWAISAILRPKVRPSEASEGRTFGSFEATLTEQSGTKIEESVTLKLFAGDYKTKKTIFADEKTAQEIKAELEKAAYQVSEIAKKETSRTPPPPFTTSTLQQAAINSLGFSAKQTMMIAQKLYEQGHITYMRTDSVNLSLPSMLAAKKTIEKFFGKNYALESPRFYKTRAKGAQEAHEAIRPTHPEVAPDELNGSLDINQHKLYRLIWRRMVASQMQPAIFDSVKVLISAKSDKNEYIFQANGSTIKFDGYLKIYGDSPLTTSPNKNEKGENPPKIDQFKEVVRGKIPVTENILPPLEEKEILNLEKINTTRKETAPPPRYNEATLVKVLEENGIGRPSTYAPTISTIIERKYVDKNEERRLFPLEIGFLVNDLLVEHFGQIVDMKFTATLEEDFDRIAEGKKQWVPVIREFYEPFHKNLEGKSKEIKKEDVLEKLDKKCPECGGDLLVRFGRFGKFIACNNFPKCKYTEKTAEEKKVEDENSGETCDKCGAPMVVKRGKYGAFLGCSKYPDCKNIKKITSDKTTGVKCPKCEKGEILERRSRKGRLFYGCSAYPKCDFSLWNRPTGKKCEKCGSLMVYQMKGTEKCSNKECK
ncbi:MAG: type I DNA topoisomerase [Patescibacteria group bacterium]|nr:type I DNA topoisomerase [Patescibacteria group bacterium]